MPAKRRRRFRLHSAARPEERRAGRHRADAEVAGLLQALGGQGLLLHRPVHAAEGIAVRRNAAPARPFEVPPDRRSRAAIRRHRIDGTGRARRLKTYYAGKTRITDRSLEILGKMPSLERLAFWQCAGLSDAGIAHLTALPHLREISLDGLPGITRAAPSLFPTHVRVNYSA